MKYFYILILMIICFSSCFNDIENISVVVIIRDIDTNVPIANAKVLVTCWVYRNTPDGSYTGKKELKIFTDQNGIYKCKFEKGADIFVEVFAEGYKDGFTKQRASNNNSINIDLVKN